MTKQEFLKANGFSTDEITYCIINPITNNTFQFKDYLKSLGCIYSPLLKWHINKNIDNLIQPLKIVPIKFEQLYRWDETYHAAFQLDGIENLVSTLLAPAAANVYKYYGNIGQRYYDIKVKYQDNKSFVNQYGQYTFLYTFITLDNEYKIIWFVREEKQFKFNQELLLTGTVKDHRIYKGEKTTIVNRCIIKTSSIDNN